MMTRFTLHGMYRSGPTYKVGLMLALSGEPFDYVHVGLRSGEHKQPAHLARNRYGQVPALVDEGADLSLCQSAAILEYLSDTLGKFGGASALERARIREWLFWEFDRLAPPLFRSRAMALGFRQGTDDVKAMYATEGQAALHVLDAELSGKTWLVGDRPTIADIDVYVPVHYAADGGFDLSSHANITRWKARFEALPGFGTPAQLLPEESRAAAA